VAERAIDSHESKPTKQRRQLANIGGNHTVHHGVDPLTIHADLLEASTRHAVQRIGLRITQIALLVAVLVASILAIVVMRTSDAVTGNAQGLTPQMTVKPNDLHFCRAACEEDRWITLLISLKQDEPAERLFSKVDEYYKRAPIPSPLNYARTDGSSCATLVKGYWILYLGPFPNGDAALAQCSTLKWMKRNDCLAVVLDPAVTPSHLFPDQ
jgi:hypothetical protein